VAHPVKTDEPVESKQKIADLLACIDRQTQELKSSREELARMHLRLTKMQAQIVAQEKMASLGTMTAGIAHEIKNPLNFIVNFAALSVDLVDEIREEITNVIEKPSKASRDSLDELLRTLADNCAKVNHHGLRADGIVRSMQLHARGQSGQSELTDINRLLEDNIAFAFHGARSSDREFNATIDKRLESNLPKIQAVPQELGRVFLNLFSNGFYAVREATSKGRVPTIRVSTHDVGDSIQIRIADNGLGIPDAVRQHIFEPFFTTKPAGEGTGLGLSITHDIVVKMHRGTIRFESVIDEGTEFIIELPKA
jgi:signal transduction histidine kinase